MAIKFTHKVVDRIRPWVMMNDYEKGTKVIIVEKHPNEILEISNGKTSQFCHSSQIEKI